MTILQYPHPMLRTVCSESGEITSDDIRSMFALMQANHGAGLSAPQVGINARVFVTDWGQVFVNPVIAAKSEVMVIFMEGCLSLPGVQAFTLRHKWIELDTGEVFRGKRAIVIQHEMDHLDGRLIIDNPGE